MLSAGYKKRCALVRCSLLLICFTWILIFIQPYCLAASQTGNKSRTLSPYTAGSEMEMELGTLLTNGQLDDVKDIMLGTKNGFQEAMIGEAGIGSVISRVLIGIAMAMALVSLFLEVAREFERGEKVYSLWPRFLVKMTVAFLVIAYSGRIANGIRDAGNLLVTYMSDALKVALSRQVYPEVEVGTKTGLYKEMMFSIKGAVPVVALGSLNFLIRSASYVTFIEFAIRRALLPIAVSDIVSDGMRSPGMRFLKHYFAVYLRMAIVLFAVGTCWLIADVRMTRSLLSSAAFDGIMCRLVAMNLIRQGNSILDDITGGP